MIILDTLKVESLLVAAAKVEKNLPPVIQFGFSNSWLPIESCQHGISRESSKHSNNLAHMQTTEYEFYSETMSLLAWLNGTHPLLQYGRILWGRASGVDTYATARKCGISPSTTNRRYKQGVSLLVERLNGHENNIPPAVKKYFLRVR